MKNPILVILLLLVANAVPAAMQEEERPVEVSLPFTVEMQRPIKLEMSFKAEQGEARYSVRETAKLTPLKQRDDGVIYRYESQEMEVVNMAGFPPLLDKVLLQIAEASKGIRYEYLADATGYPVELTETRQIKSLMKKASRSMKKWTKDFAKAEGLDKTQRSRLMAFLEQSLEEAFPDEGEALNRTVLETGQLIFYGTGRSLYRDYYTEFESTRYFEPGRTAFHTIDSWEVVSFDEERREAVIKFIQQLNDEKYKGFMERLKPALMKELGPEQEAGVDALVAKYRLLQLNRQAEYIIDLSTGLPRKGVIRSEQTFDGTTNVETIEFTMGYTE